MTLLNNITGSTNADLIGNDANSTLTVKNINAGSALTAIGFSGATGASALVATFTANVGGATVAPLQLVASTASQAWISFQGVLISTASINLAANKTAFIIPVYHASQAVWGYVAASIGPS